MASNHASALRFADFGALPKRMLAPIEGYEKKPLVSLEEAVEPLIDLVPKVQRNVYIVKQNCQEPEDGLSPDESASIMLYTFESEPSEDSLYAILNDTLRSEQRQKLRPWFLYLRLIITALGRLPSERVVVNRGVRQDLRAQYATGKTFIWWGFSSCTASIDVLESEQFFGQSGTRTLFQIDCHSGKDIRKHSFIPSENEILLLPARQFVVQGCLNSGNGLHIIQLKETEPPHPLLEPVPVPKPLAPFKGNPVLKTPLISTERKPPVSQKKTTQPSKSTRMIHIPPNATWTRKGIIVAGGRGKGMVLNGPRGLCVDDRDGTVFIADRDNHRIVAWKQGDNTTGRLVAGGENEMSRLYGPRDVLTDKETDSLIISHGGSVTRWSLRGGNTEGETIIDKIDPQGLAMDDESNLYISDDKKHEVRRYRRGEKTGGIVVAGGNGQGDGLNQLNEPTYIFVDGEGAVYVSDNKNHRVMKWVKGATEGIIVAGHGGKGEDLTQLWYPQGVFVDSEGTLYVSEAGNDRVTRWCKGMQKGEIIVGGNESGKGADQFDFPMGLSFDHHGNLYVADTNNHRVQRFDIVSIP